MKKSAPLKEKQRPPEKAHPLENLPLLTKSVTWDTGCRVTSGYGGLKIPLGQIRLTAKNGGYIGGFAALHSDFSVEVPKRALLALFLGPRGPGVNFFPNIGKWGIQSGATICPDHTALFRSI